MTERFSNLAQSALATATVAGASTLTVVNASTFPSNGTFKVIVDNEIFNVTAVSGTTFTVQSGWESTTPAAHAAGAGIYQIMTAGIMTNAYNVTDNYINVLNGINGSNQLVADGTTDNAPALQNIINALVQAAVNGTSHDTVGTKTLLWPAGVYKFNSGVINRPWIKWVSQGSVKLDFSSLGTAAAYAIRCHNQDAPYNNSVNSATNNGFWLNGDNGVFLIYGPGNTSGTTRGLDLGNYRVATLAAAITTTTGTTITLTSAANMPAYGPYYITVDSETMYVTAGQGTVTLTVIRGALSTTAATHAAGATVQQFQNIYTDFRETRISNVKVYGFYAGLYMEPFDLYMMTAYRSAFTNCYYSVQIGNYLDVQQNSGEKLAFIDCLFDAAAKSVYYVDGPAMDMTFTGCSFDFIYGPVITYTANAGYCKTSLVECHLENFGSIAASSAGSSSQITLQMTNCKLVSTNSYFSPVPVNGTNTLAAAITTTAGTTLTLSGTANLPTVEDYVLLVDTEKMLVTAGQGSTTLTVQRGWASTTAGTHAAGAVVSAPGAYASGAAAPWTPLFTGHMTLTVDGLISGYAASYNWANVGVFMCDANVTVNRIKFMVPNVNQMTARAVNLVYNGNFNLASNGLDLDQSDVPGWTRTAHSGFTCTIDNTYTYGTSSEALKITSLQNGGNYYVIVTDSIALPAVGGLQTLPIMFGGTSTGLMHLETEFMFYRQQMVPNMSIASITRSGATATVTTATNHGLANNQVVTITGASVADYNRRGFITVTGTNTFTYNMYSNTTAATPAVAASGATLAYSPEQQIYVGASTSYGINWSSMYADATQPNYTGNRLYWCRDQYVTAYGPGSWPAGATHVKIQLTISGYNNGDQCWLGELLGNYI